MLTIGGRAAARRMAMATISSTTLPIRSVQQARAFTATSGAFEAAARQTEVKEKKPRAARAAKATDATKTNKKPAAKKAKKPAKKKKAPRVHKTPEEKEAAKVLAKEKNQAKKVADKQKILRSQALLKEAPRAAKGASASPWLVYIRENFTSGDVSGKSALGPKMGVLAREFADLSATEKENLQQRADQRKEEIQRAYHAWVDSQPVEVIALANEARATLNEQRKARGLKQYPLLEDPRLPSRIVTAYTLFIQDFAKGHVGHPIERLTEGAARWKGMSDAEKRPFETMAQGQKEKTEQQRRELKEKVKALKLTYKTGATTSTESG